MGEMSYNKYDSCPLCGNEITKELYIKDIYLHSCQRCGFPNMSKMMDYYKEIGRPYKLDFFYAFFEYVDGMYDLEVPRAANGNVLSLLLPSTLNWSMSDEVRGAILYAVINTAKDGSFYEFRGVYSNPYFAQEACDDIDDENERRGIKTKAHYERIPINHPCGSSMFKR
jgi:hypothetical protein